MRRRRAPTKRQQQMGRQHQKQPSRGRRANPRASMQGRAGARSAATMDKKLAKGAAEAEGQNGAQRRSSLFGEKAAKREAKAEGVA